MYLFYKKISAGILYTCDSRQEGHIRDVYSFYVCVITSFYIILIKCVLQDNVWYNYTYFLYIYFG